MDPKQRKWWPIDHEQQVRKHRKVVPPDLGSVAKMDSYGSSRRAGTKNSGIGHYSGVWDEKKMMHLLRRSLTGVSGNERNRFHGLSMDECVDLLLTEEGDLDPPVNTYSGYNNVKNDPDVRFGETWIHAPTGEFNYNRILTLKSWLIDHLSKETTSIHQKMMLFLHNLLVTEIWGVGNARASYQYFNLIHRYALGNYRELIKKITIDPAMLFYLNGVSNSKDAPDENYARELQELFTVGKGPGSQYTEQDVLNAARVLTGWTIDWDDLEREGELKSFFNSDIHDIEDKEFSSFYGGKVIKGGYGLDGEKETDELLDMIFETNEISRYLSRRLYQFFVFPEIDDVVEEMIITPMAQSIRSSGYELKPALDLLLRSDHFYDAENIGVMIKSPVDFLVGTFKSMALNNTASGLNGAHQYYQSILWTMSDYGMEIGDPPSVSGWSPYYQSPGFDRLWITTDTIQKRARTIDTILFWGFWINDDHHPQFDLLSFIGTFDQPEDPDVLIEDLSAFLLATPLPDINREELRRVLLNGQTNGYYWTQAWQDYQNNPTQTNENTVLNRLRPMFQILFQLSEYQLM